MKDGVWVPDWSTGEILTDFWGVCVFGLYGGICLADDSQRGDYPMEQGLVFFLQSAWIEPGVSLVIEGSGDRRCKRCYNVGTQVGFTQRGGGKRVLPYYCFSLSLRKHRI